METLEICVEKLYLDDLSAQPMTTTDAPRLPRRRRGVPACRGRAAQRRRRLPRARRCAGRSAWPAGRLAAGVRRVVRRASVRHGDARASRPTSPTAARSPGWSRAGRGGAGRHRRGRTGSRSADGPVRLTLPGTRAASPRRAPARWADGTTVAAHLPAFGLTGAPEFDVAVDVPGEPVIQRAGPGGAASCWPRSRRPGLRRRAPSRARLSRGDRPPPVRRSAPWTLTPRRRRRAAPRRRGYLRRAIEVQAQVEEIALVCAARRSTPARRAAIRTTSSPRSPRRPSASQDRLAVVSATQLMRRMIAALVRAGRRGAPSPAQRDAVAAYAPWLARRGSRRDRRRDRYATDRPGRPRLRRDRRSWTASAARAGAPPTSLVTTPSTPRCRSPATEQGFALLDARVNLLRGRPSAAAWRSGGRARSTPETAATSPTAGWCTASCGPIRRVARAAGLRPERPAAVVHRSRRVVSGVLIEAFRSGVLRGETPDRGLPRALRRDDQPARTRSTTARSSARSRSRRPSPMEFITLRLTLGAAGTAGGGRAMSIIPSLEDPLPAHRFLVSLDPTDAYLPFAQSAIITAIAAGQFSEVTGLGADLEVLAHPEGGRNDYVHQLPVRHSYPQDRAQPRAWSATPGCSSGTRPGCPSRSAPAATARSSCSPPAASRPIGWIFRGGLAAAWKGPQLKAGDNAVAVESIEIAHEGLLQVPLTPPGVADDHDRAPPDPLRRRAAARRGRLRAALRAAHGAPRRGRTRRPRGRPAAGERPLARRRGALVSLPINFLGREFAEARLEIVEPQEDAKTDDPAALQPGGLQAHQGEHLRRDPDPGPRRRRRCSTSAAAAGSLAMDLLVDTSDDPKKSVHTEYVAAIEGAMAKDGKLHAPPIVMFVWAQPKFTGVLTSLDVNYLLFHTDGTPLRAKLGVKLKEYRPVKVQLKEVEQTSPDVEKRYVVRAGETLSSISSAVFRDPAHWREIARGQRDHRPAALAPGTVLTVPPLARGPPMTRRRHPRPRPARALLRPGLRRRGRRQPLDPESMGDVLRGQGRDGPQEADQRRPEAQQLRRHDLRPQVVRLRPVPIGSQIHVELRLRRAHAVDDAAASSPRSRPDFPADGSPTLLVRGLDALTKLKGSKPPPDKVVYRDKADWQIAQEIGKRHGLAREGDRRGSRPHDDVPGERRRRQLPQDPRPRPSTSTSSCTPTRRPARTR